MNEEILGAIETIKAKGVAEGLTFSTTHINLVFTPSRVVVAQTARLGKVGGALVGGGIAELVLRRQAGKKAADLSQLSPESILKADKANFDIPYSDIVKVEMKKPGVFTTPKINISTARKEHKFFAKEKKLFDQHVNLVRSVLGDRVIVR